MRNGSEPGIADAGSTVPNGQGPSLNSARSPTEAEASGTAGDTTRPHEARRGFLSDAWGEFRSLSALSKLLTTVTVAGFALGIVAWFWPSPLDDFRLDPRVIAIAYALDTQQTEGVVSAGDFVKRYGPQVADTGTVEAALTELERGNPQPVEGLLQEIEARALQKQAAAGNELAQAVLHRASIAFVEDKTEALRLYRRATEIAPTNMIAWRGQGDAALFASTAAEASDAYKRYADLADASGTPGEQVDARHRLGESLIRLSRFEETAEVYGQALDIAEAQLRETPLGVEEQRAVALTHERIGDLRWVTNDTDGAAESYAKGRTIRDALTATHPNDLVLKRDLSVSLERAGNLELSAGDTDMALQHYEASLKLAEDIAAKTPNNRDPQRDLAVAHEKVGDAHFAASETALALESYETSFAIRQALVSDDQGNAQRQRDLSIAHQRIGDVRLADNDTAGALESYRAAFAIVQVLATADPDNTSLQRGLIVSRIKLAEAGETPTAHYAAALAVAEALESSGWLPPQDAWMVQDLRDRVERSRSSAE